MKTYTLCIAVMCAVAMASADSEGHQRVVRSPQGFFRERLRERFENRFGHNQQQQQQQQQPLVAPPGGSAASANADSRHFELRGPFGGGISWGRSNANSQAVSSGK